VDGEEVDASLLAGALKAAGFTPGIKGYLKRAPQMAAMPEPEMIEEDA
jgi:hypothetical protein